MSRLAQAAGRLRGLARGRRIDPFAGKVAVVTGAGSGIGRALALALVARGAKVALSDLDERGLQETADLAAGSGYPAEVFTSVVDVSRREDVTRFAAEVFEHFHVVHQIYNNAGVASAPTLLPDTGYEEFEKVLGVNLWGVVHGTKEFLPHLLASGDGHVVNVSSLNGIMAQPGMTPYLTSKFGVRGFTEGLRTEAIRHKWPLKVTVVHPGGVKTSIAASVAQQAEGRELTAAERKRQKVYEEKLFTMAASDAASQILDGVARGRGRVRLGQTYAVDRLVRLMPESYPRLIALWDRFTFGK